MKITGPANAKVGVLIQPNMAFFNQLMPRRLSLSTRNSTWRTKRGKADLVRFRKFAKKN